MSSISVEGGESYPGRSFSIAQLLHATKRKIRGITLGGRVVTTMNRAEVDALEEDALEVLSLIRSMRNTLAPVNRTPQEVLFLIPEYWNHRERDKNIIKLTHVCRGWRELFTSRPSLWNRLDCVDVNKTRIYLERSKSSPLEISLEGDEEKGASYHCDALSLVDSHISRRIRSLTITGDEDVLHDITMHFSFPISLLEHLSIKNKASYYVVLDHNLFGGNLPSIRTLELDGVISGLFWKDLPNLTSLSLSDTGVSTTALLDFFEHAPMLHKVLLDRSIPRFSDAPSERVVFLPHLQEFTITGPSPYSVLLNHLSTPPNALVVMKFDLTGDQLPIQDHHPESLANFGHLSNITQINVGFCGKLKHIKLCGPSGRHHIRGEWVGRAGDECCPVTVNARILQSVIMFDVSNVERLAVTQYHVSPQTTVGETPPYHVLFPMDNLRTLTLTECYNVYFFTALNPEETPRGVILCPLLTELVLYAHSEKRFYLERLLKMAKARDSRGLRLESVVVICKQQLAPPQEVFKLRQYVSRVEYKLEDQFPEWDEA